jgi:multidrug efflux pump subunit AcrB
VTAEGFAPDEIERLIARPAVEAWVGVEGIVAVTAVSEVGRAELYIEAGPQMSEHHLSQVVIQKLPSIDLGNLPAAATIAAYELVPNFKGPPPPKQDEQAFARVEVKREVAALYGIDTLAIMEAIRAGSPPPGEQATQKSVDALRRLTISASDGRKIPMSEIVAVKLERLPSRSIYHWPQDDQQEKPQ